MVNAYLFIIYFSLVANLPIPPLIPASQVIPSAAEPFREPSSSVVAPKDPRVRQLNKEFALEFHNSVLQTTQMQLGNAFLFKK